MCLFQKSELIEGLEKVLSLLKRRNEMNNCSENLEKLFDGMYKLKVS